LGEAVWTRANASAGLEGDRDVHAGGVRLRSARDGIDHGFHVPGYV